MDWVGVHEWAVSEMTRIVRRGKKAKYLFPFSLLCQISKRMMDRGIE